MAGLPHGVWAMPPTGDFASPPPCGWSRGDITTPRTIGRRPMWRMWPAPPTLRFSWSMLPSCPTVARQWTWMMRIVPDGSRTWAYSPSFATSCAKSADWRYRRIGVTGLYFFSGIRLDPFHEVALDPLALGQGHDGLLPIGLLPDPLADPPRLAVHGRGVHGDDVDLERLGDRLRDLVLRRGLRDGERVAATVRAGHRFLGDDRAHQNEIASHADTPLWTAPTSARAARSSSAGRATSTVSAPSPST